MEGFDMLKRFHDGTEGSEIFAGDLKGLITSLVECTNAMLQRVPREDLMRMSVLCNNKVEIAFQRYRKTDDEPKYVIVYFSDYEGDNDEVIVATSNKSEEQQLDYLRTFLDKRYNFNFSYAEISLDQTHIALASDYTYDEQLKKKLISHLSLAFPDKTFIIP